MKWPWGTEFNTEQRQATAKLLMNTCQVIILAILVRPFIPELAKNLTLYDNVYGFILVIILFMAAMRLIDFLPSETFIQAVWPLLAFLAFIIIYWLPYFLKPSKKSKK